MRTIAHLYDTYDEASQVAQALEAAGFGHDNVSVVANQAGAPVIGPNATTAAMTDDTTTVTTGTTGPSTGTAAGTGASVGTLLGGGAGLLAGIGALAIPGVGPVVAAGWLVAALTGAGAGAGIGGLLGALTGSGVNEEHAHVYAEGVRRGGTLVTARVEDAQASEAERIMQQFHPVDIDDRAATYRTQHGWTGFDETGTGLTPEELRAQQLRGSTGV